MRIFVASPMPDGVGEMIATWMNLARELAPGLRWVRSRSFHITYRFLGDVGPEVIDAAADRIGAFAPDASPVDFVLDRLGTFGGRRNRPPSVYWLGGSFSRTAPDLAEALADIADDRGRSAPHGRFVPHVTVARRGRSGNGHDLPPFGPWKGTLEKVIIYNSILRSSGPEYQELETFDLGFQERR